MTWIMKKRNLFILIAVSLGIVAIPFIFNLIAYNVLN